MNKNIRKCKEKLLEKFLFFWRIIIYIKIREIITPLYLAQIG